MTETELKRINLDFAGQQLEGFTHAKEGYGIISLIESMGLTSEEWEQLKKRSITRFRPTDVVKINEYFSQKNKS